MTIKYVRLNITLPEKLYREFKILKEGKRGVSALTREAMEKWCQRERNRLERALARDAKRKAKKKAKKKP